MIRTWILIAAAFLLAACSRTPSPYPDAEFPDMIKIAPLDEALTFARIQGESGPELLAVASWQGDHLAAWNISRTLGAEITDPISFFQERGYDSLKTEFETRFPESAESFAVADLILPVDLTDSHIAAGTNFPEHAEESDVQEGPFLFAKEVTPTPGNASVSAGAALLDYEVELAFVTLDDAPLPDAPQRMGLILANDFTDREALMRNINPRDITSGEGFTTGKSAPGYLPLGNLFVIPRDMNAFVAAMHLNLEVNGKLRQEAAMTEWIWDIQEIFRQTEARKDVTWKYKDGRVGLPIVNGAVPARTLVLAGTPDGTIFQGLSRGTMAKGALRWLAFGFNKSIVQRIIDSYVKDARKQKSFLQPGDVVIIQVERLGKIETRVVE